VYHARTESRPHRPAVQSETAAQVLESEARGGRLDPGAVSAVLKAARVGHRPVRRMLPADLTEREAEVLQLGARGLSNREVAARLVVSQKTIGNHIEHIYSKIGVSTRAAATLFALQTGLLTAPVAAGKMG
jgi:DNA-binding NarL/FixJ family response regulator